MECINSKKMPPVTRFNDGFEVVIGEKPCPYMYSVYFYKVVKGLSERVKGSIWEDWTKTGEWLEMMLWNYNEGADLVFFTLHVDRGGLKLVQRYKKLFSSVSPLSLRNQCLYEPFYLLNFLLRLASRADLDKKIIWLLGPKEEFVIECPICCNFYINSENHFTPTRCSSGHKVCNRCWQRWYEREELEPEWQEVVTVIGRRYNYHVANYILEHMPFFFFPKGRHRECLVCTECIA